MLLTFCAAKIHYFSIIVKFQGIIVTSVPLGITELAVWGMCRRIVAGSSEKLQATRQRSPLRKAKCFSLFHPFWALWQ